MSTPTTAAPAGKPVPVHELQRQLEALTQQIPELERAYGDKLRLGQSAAQAEQALSAAKLRQAGLRTAIDAARKAAQAEAEQAELKRLAAERERQRLAALRSGWLGYWQAALDREAQARGLEEQAVRVRATQTAGWSDAAAAQAEAELRAAGVPLPPVPKPADWPTDLHELRRLAAELGRLKQLAGRTPADKPLQEWQPPR